MYNKISNFRFWCQKVLPLVYDDSLSYYETLCKFSEKLNEVINNTNELSEQYQNVGATLEEITTKLNELDTNMTGFINDIQREFSQLETNINNKVDTKLASVDEKIAQVDSTISRLETEVDSKIAELEIKVNTEIAQATRNLENIINIQLKVFDERLVLSEERTKNWVILELNDFLSKIPEVQNVVVISPITGQLVPLQEAINSLYDIARNNALTASEYDSLLLTADEYDRAIVNGVPRGLTAIEYDSYARRYLWKDTSYYTFSPFTGLRESTESILSFSIDLLKASGSYSASEYDSIGKTADEYDLLSLTAYNYDWHSNALIA